MNNTPSGTINQYYGFIANNKCLLTFNIDGRKVHSKEYARDMINKSNTTLFMTDGGWIKFDNGTTSFEYLPEYPNSSYGPKTKCKSYVNDIRCGEAHYNITHVFCYFGNKTDLLQKTDLETDLKQIGKSIGCGFIPPEIISFHSIS
ncbi:hypothetical protein BB559_001017 [Furculomyces boomerangus]|uniref:Uncharacterized protein n=2 Tax=Harpellales TaxID=61421 RepID=A0A2T9Z3G9_9FUNG|nr:hypothetical protein BB559_001017 [Furculomyces boomerangus]PWA02961.1 hypothetical protein BB558_000871 [Smittium angustum]